MPPQKRQASIQNKLPNAADARYEGAQPESARGQNAMAKGFVRAGAAEGWLLVTSLPQPETMKFAWTA